MDDQPCVINYVYVTPDGCVIRVTGTGDCDGPGFVNNFTGTITFGGWGENCRHMTIPINYYNPNPGTTTLYVIYTLVGGTDFCSATDISFSGNAQLWGDAIEALNENSDGILAGFKTDVGC